MLPKKKKKNKNKNKTKALQSKKSHFLEVSVVQYFGSRSFNFPSNKLKFVPSHFTLTCMKILNGNLEGEIN